MAKKKTIDLENAAPLRELPSSGIQVNYKHQTIIASDETCEYALLTGGKVCEANIGVVYVQPSAPAYAITYYDAGLTRTSGPENAAAGEQISVQYTVGSSADLSLFAIDILIDGEPIPYDASVIGTTSRTLSISFIMPSDNVTVDVSQK